MVFHNKIIAGVVFAAVLLGGGLYFFPHVFNIKTTVPRGWNVFHDSESGFEFQYPETLTTEYISHVDWPPKVEILETPFTCIEAGSEIDRAGRTEKRIVDNRTYCVTKITEGAAGSIYTQYAYLFEKDTKTVIFMFSLRAVQCENYNEEEMKKCKGERETFDIDGVIDRMARTLQRVSNSN